jgi:hypothetical protein
MHGPATRDERQTAVADVGCKQQTNLIGVSQQVESRYENGSIEKNMQELSKLRPAIEAEVEALNTAIAKYGTG